MKVLFLTPRVPYPLDAGTSLRNFRLLQSAAGEHEVHLLSFLDRPLRPDHLEALQAVCRRVELRPAPPHPLYASAGADRQRAAAGHGVPAVVARVRRGAARDARRGAVRRGGGRGDRDGALPGALPGARARARGEGPRRVFSDHNVEHLLQRRAYLVDRATPRRWPKALYSLLQARKLARFEAAACRLADATLTVSDDDAAALGDLEPRGRYRVVPNAIDPDAYPGARAGRPGRRCCSPARWSTARTRMPPAGCWTRSCRWSGSSVPEARVFVVGRGPAPDLVARGQHDSRIAVTGQVESMDPYWAPLDGLGAADAGRRRHPLQGAGGDGGRPADRLDADGDGGDRRRGRRRTTWAASRRRRWARRSCGCWRTRRCANGSPRRRTASCASSTTGGWWRRACSTSTASLHEPPGSTSPTARDGPHPSPLPEGEGAGSGRGSKTSPPPRTGEPGVGGGGYLCSSFWCCWPGCSCSFRQPLWDRLDLETKHRIVAAYSRLTARRVETADEVRTSPQVANRIGVNVFLDQEVEIANRRRSLEMLRAAGVGWIRQQIPWKEIERDAKGDFWDRKWNKDAWANYDNVIDLAHEYGIEVIARVDTSPDWSRPGRSPDERLGPGAAGALRGLRRLPVRAGDALPGQDQGVPDLERAEPGDRVGAAGARSGRLHPAARAGVRADQGGRP